MTKRSNDYEDAVIIVNPVSGLGESKDRTETIQRMARELGWKGVIIETTLKKAATEISLEELKKGKKHFIVCGGDGTVMEVIGALVNKDAVLGVVPFGTGNLLAKNLHLPLELEESLKVALTGQTQKIDVGKANETFFAIIAGIGLDAEMIRGADRELKNKLGMAAYLVSAVKSLFIPAGKYKVILDKKNSQVFRAKGILVANMSELAAGIEIVPGADPQSGSLRVGVIKLSRWYALISLIFNAVTGNINKSPHYTLLKGNHVEIQCMDKSRPYECDGNDFPPTSKLVVTIYPAAVSVRSKL